MKVVATMIIMLFFDIRGMACRLRGVRIVPARPDAYVRNSLEK
jgi:hypothetical protein